MKDIKGYENLYLVTSCGKIWSYKTKRFLKPFKTKDGYLQVELCKNGVGKKCYLHRLVADAYIPNINNLPQVGHDDDIKEHCYIKNLYWTTQAENNIHNDRAEKVASKERRHVYCVELNKIFDGQSTAARELGIYQSSISFCCRNEEKTAGGFHWRYIENTDISDVSGQISKTKTTVNI